MLIGAHVSPAGGPAKAVERGTERGARAIQIFNQSPRMWKPTILRISPMSSSPATCGVVIATVSLGSFGIAYPGTDC